MDMVEKVQEKELKVSTEPFSGSEETPPRRFVTRLQKPSLLTQGTRRSTTLSSMHSPSKNSKKRDREKILFDSLNALAPEVQQTKRFEKRFHFLHKPLSSYHSIRETYRVLKDTYRENARDRTAWEEVMHTSSVMWKKLKFHVRKIFSSNRSLFIGAFIDLLIDIAFCILYMTEFQVNASTYSTDLVQSQLPFWLRVYRPVPLFRLAIAFSIWNLSSLAVRVSYSVDKIKTIFSVNGILDLVLCIPFLVFAFTDNGRFVYIPYFLRMIVVVIRLSDVIRLRSNWDLINFDNSKERLIILGSYMVAVLYIAICAFHYSEFYFGGRTNITVMQCFYLMVITISTVGYGDIYPTTNASMFVIILTIFYAISVLPGLIAAIVETIKSRKAGGGYVSRTSKRPFVVISGRFETSEQLMDILNEFYWRAAKKDRLRIVFLSSVPASFSITSTIGQKSYRELITFIHGSPLSERDMSRVNLQAAAAAFIIPDKNPNDYCDEADRVILRSLAFDNYAPDTPLYVYNIIADAYSLEQKITTAAICLDSLKQTLLAYNCLYRGSATLLINLLKHATPRDRYNEPWQAQYGDGAGNRIYAGKVNPFFIGQTFSKVAYFLFFEFQVVFFGVATKTSNSKMHLLLNPGKNYIMKEDDDCYFIAQSERDVLSIAKMNQDKFLNVIKVNQDMFEHTEESRRFGYRRSESYLVTSLDTLELGYPEALNRTKNNLPLCRLRKTPAKLNQIAVNDASQWRGHILVCTHSLEVFEFVCTLRSESRTAEEYKRLLFLIPREPTPEDFAFLLQFPGVFYLVGDARKKADLFKAGLEGADKVVLMNMANSSQTSEDASEYVDSNTVVVSHLIYSLYPGKNRKKFVINDLHDKENVKFLRPTPMKYKTTGANNKEIIVTSRELSTEDSYTYTPVFAAGRVIASSMMGSILYQTYYNPMIVTTFRYFCGMRTEDEIHLDSILSGSSPSLYYVTIPEPFIGLPYSVLFKEMTLFCGLLPIGLYRDEISDEFRNRLPFVYSNPLPSVLLKESDLVYVLASASQLNS